MKQESRYTLDVREISARATAGEDGFKVLAGSTANGEPTRIKSPAYQAIRDRLVADGTLRKPTLADGVPADLMLFARDHAFANASAAATVVLGYQANGPAVWKGEGGANAPRARSATPAKMLGRRMMLLAKQARKDSGAALDLWQDSIVRHGLILCQSADGWSLHAPRSSDEDIAEGDAPPLLSGPGYPTQADYDAAAARLEAAQSHSPAT